jgi:methanol--5-hydroxybenzimidazolylcobamide Co-methyltransferase
VRSDAWRDPQAFIIAPENAVAIAESIVQAPDAYRAGKAAGLAAIRLMSEAQRDGVLRIAPREMPWLDRMRKAIEALPDTESEFVAEMLGELDLTRFVAADYEIG